MSLTIRQMALLRRRMAQDRINMDQWAGLMAIYNEATYDELAYFLYLLEDAQRVSFYWLTFQVLEKPIAVHRLTNIIDILYRRMEKHAPMPVPTRTSHMGPCTCGDYAPIPERQDQDQGQGQGQGEGGAGWLG